MTEIFNKNKIKETRRLLRRNCPEAEFLLWQEIRNRQILGKRFLRQFSIFSSIVDFYCPKLRLVIEIDGKDHERKQKQQEDINRQKYIEELGIQFIRFKNVDIQNNIKKVIENIKSKIIEIESAEPPNPPFAKGG